MLPRDPFILLSYVNTLLRDNYSSLDDLCASLDEDKDAIIAAVKPLGYRYDAEENQFVRG